MGLDKRQTVRVTKGLVEAAGYLELGMTRHVIECLDQLGDVGPLAPAAEFLRGEALRMERQDAAAAPFLQTAAEKTPSPHNRSAWLALSVCYRATGDQDRAVESLARARGAQAPLPASDRLPERPDA